MQKKVAVLERPNSPVGLADLVNGQANLVRELGILAMTLDAKVTPELPDTRRLYGVVVAAIPIEFAALNPGLNPGDVIYEMNSNKIRTLGECATRYREQTRESGRAPGGTRRDSRIRCIFAGVSRYSFTFRRS